MSTMKYTMNNNANMMNYTMTMDLLLSLELSSFWDRKFSISSSFSFFSSTPPCLGYSFLVNPWVNADGPSFFWPETPAGA